MFRRTANILTPRFLQHYTIGSHGINVGITRKRCAMHERNLR